MTAALAPAISGPDHAAVMVMLLEDQDASLVLSKLTQDELRLLGTRMCGLGEIDPRAILSAIARFAECAAQPGIAAQDRTDRVQRLFDTAVGPIKAEGLMRQVAPEHAATGGHSALDLARWLAPEVIVPLIADEHPQAIAVLLVQIDPGVAAQVLSALPEPMQTQVVHRIATLGPVSRQAVAMLEEVLSSRIAGLHGRRPLEMGGVREAAAIMNSAAAAVGKRIVPAIGKIDKKLARDLESEMFRFEHLFVLDPQGMGALLREVESAVLIDALKGIGEEERDLFFRAMSSRAADGVRDEIEARGRIRRDEVDTAQREIIAIAKRLAAEGSIMLGGGDEDYV